MLLSRTGCWEALRPLRGAQEAAWWRGAGPPLSHGLPQPPQLHPQSARPGAAPHSPGGLGSGLPCGHIFGELFPPEPAGHGVQDTEGSPGQCLPRPWGTWHLWGQGPGAALPPPPWTGGKRGSRSHAESGAGQKQARLLLPSGLSLRVTPGLLLGAGRGAWRHLPSHPSKACAKPLPVHRLGSLLRGAERP